MRSTLLMFFVFIVFPTTSFARDYYVSPSGSGTNGTLSSPCALSYANKVADAGDTVYLLDGEYDGTEHSRYYIHPSNSGTRGNYITFEAAPGSKPVLKHYGQYLDGYSYATIAGHRKHYIKVVGLTVHYPFQGPLMLAECTNWIFEDCEFKYRHNLKGGHVSSRMLDCSHIYFLNCTWDNPINPGSGDLVASRRSTNLLFKDCYFGNSGHNGYEEFDPGNENFVAKHAFINCTFENKLHTGLGFGNRDSMYYLVDSCTFKNQGSKDNSVYEGHCGPDPALYARGQYQIVRKNTFYNNSAHISMNASDHLLTNYKNNWLYHNTLFRAKNHNGTSCVSDNYLTGVAFYVGGSENYGAFNNYFVNNIVSISEESHMVERARREEGRLEPSNNTMAYNCFYNPETVYLYFTQDLGSQTLAYYETNDSQWSKNTNLDPLMFDPDNQNFVLLPTSPCIDRGTYLTTVKSSTGSGKQFYVDNAYCFFDGWGFNSRYVSSDSIKTENRQTATIASINYETGLITVTSPISWTKNEGIALDYHGSAPDIGAKEYKDDLSSVTVQAPSNLRITFD